jgi:hypothetical protein
MKEDILIIGNGTILLGDLLVSGTMKLGQRVMLELLTEEGSMHYLMNAGCSFLPRVRRSKSEFDVLVAFAAAKSKIKRTLRAENTIATPMTERLADMIVRQITLNEGYVTVTIIVTARSGTRVKVTTPPIKLE